MDDAKTRHRNRTLILVAVAIAAVGAGIWWFLATRNAVPEEAVRVADQLPPDVPLLIWTADLETLLGVAKDAGFDAEALAARAPWKEVVEALDGNPLTAGGLRGLGLDLRGPLALFLGPVDAPDLLMGLHVPLKETRGVTLAATLVDKLDLTGHIGVEATEVSGRPVAWITRLGGGAPGARTGAIIDVERGALLIFPVDFEARHADRIGAAVEAWATHLAGPRVETLTDVAAFRPALAGYRGGLLGGFFNATDGTRELLVGDEGLELSLWILASTLGAGLHLEEDGAALRLRLRAILTRAEAAPGATRDLGVLARIPGRPIAGLHLAVDLEKARAELERSLPKETYERHALVRTIRASGRALALEEGKTVLDVVTGEVGFFLGPTEADLASLMRASIGFIGLKDRVPVEAHLRPLLTGMGLLAGTEVLDGATLFIIRDHPDSEAGVLVEDDRLWFGGDVAVLRRVATGETGDLTGGTRNGETATVMRGDGALAIFVDLVAVTGLLSDDNPARDLLGALDYLTVTAGNDGAAVESAVTLHARGDSFRTAVLPKLVAAAQRSGVGARTRKVEERTRPVDDGPAAD